MISHNIKLDLYSGLLRLLSVGFSGKIDLPTAGNGDNLWCPCVCKFHSGAAECLGRSGSGRLVMH